MKRKILKMLCLLLCALSFTSCLDIKSGDETIKDDTTAKLAVLDKTKSNKSGEVKNEMTISMRSPKTLNPLLNEDVTVDTALKLVFEPLFNISEEQTVTPNLAASYELSADAMSLTVKLKEGLKWQDGEEITSADVAYSLDVLRSAPDAAVYKYVLTNIEGYHTTDTLTIQISYKEPYYPAPYNLAFPIIPKHHYGTGKNTDFDPVGSGAFALSDFDTTGYTLTAADGVNGRPKIEKVNIIISPDYETDFDAFSRGVTDFLATSAEGWYSYFAEKDCNKAVFSANSFEYIGFNNSKEMFKNQALRQAVAYCVDRDQILSSIYMSNMESSLTPVNPTAYLSSSDSLPSYDYSPDDALKTLWNAGLSPYNFTLKILVNEDNPARVETASVLAEALNQIGMNVTVDTKPFSDYQAQIAADDFDVYIGGTNLRCGFDLRPLLSSVSVYSGTNCVNFSDATMDTLLNAYAAAGNDVAAKNALREAELYISVQLPLIGIGFKNGAVMTDKNITGLTIPYINNPFVNSADWSIN